MRILIAAPVFAPSVGGVETVAKLLAEELLAIGHEVRILTLTQDGGFQRTDGLKVYRWKSFADTLRCFLWCDAAILNHPSVKLSWPLFFLRRAAVSVWHGPWVGDGVRRIKALALCHLARRAKNFGVSRYVTESLPFAASVLPNPVSRSDLQEPERGPSRDVIFLGRLVSEKRPADFIHALALLAARGRPLRASVVGGGALESALKDQVQAMGLDHVVTFCGVLTGSALDRVVASHQCMVIPSEKEPFGLVALEAIAAGVVPIGADAGGLPEAIGPCGILVPPGDPEAIAWAIEEALDNPERSRTLRHSAAMHLARHNRRAVALHYVRELGFNP